MPRSKNPVPSYSLHKPTGQAYVRLPDGNGSRRVIYLGKYGSPDSQAEYQRVLAEMRVCPAVGGRSRVGEPAAANLTVSEVLLGFMQWAATHYRTPDGRPTTEIGELRQSVRPVRELYGHTPAGEF